MLRSNLFFSAEAYRTRVKSPVDFVLGIAWALEAHEVDAKPDRKRTSLKMSSLASVLESLGQNLFYPPSVKGWDGGRAWLNGQTLLYRQNLALAMTSTTDGRFGRSADPVWVADKHAAEAGARASGLLPQAFPRRATCRPRRRQTSCSMRRSPGRSAFRYTGPSATPPTIAFARCATWR